jgi:hypothetical protein
VYSITVDSGERFPAEIVVTLSPLAGLHGEIGQFNSTGSLSSFGSSLTIEVAQETTRVDIGFRAFDDGLVEGKHTVEVLHAARVKGENGEWFSAGQQQVLQVEIADVNIFDAAILVLDPVTRLPLGTDDHISIVEGGDSVVRWPAGIDDHPDSPLYRARRSRVIEFV